MTSAEEIAALKAQKAVLHEIDGRQPCCDIGRVELLPQRGVLSFQLGNPGFWRPVVRRQVLCTSG